MVVYLSAFGMSVLLGLIADATARRNPAENRALPCIHWLCLLCAPLPVLFITCLRYGVGYDYFPTYVSDYYRYRIGDEVHSDFGFNAIYRISQWISDDYQLLFIITGALVVLSVFISAYLCTGLVAYSTLLFLFDDSYFKSISMVAQYTAIAMFLLAFALLFGRKESVPNRAIGIVCVILGVCIHSSGVIVAVAFVIIALLKNFNNLLLKISIIIPIVFFLLRSVLVTLVLRFMSQTRFASYIDSVFQGRDSLSMVLMEAFFFIIMLIILLKWKKNASRMHYIAFFMESIALSVSFLQGVPLMFRIAFFFASFHIITFPLFLRLIPNIYIKIGIGAFVLIFVTIWFFTYPVQGNYDTPLPYAFSFDPYSTYN